MVRIVICGGPEIHPTPMPKLGVERQMATDRPKVGFVTGRGRRCYAPRGNEDIERGIPDLAGVKAVTGPYVLRDLGRFDPTSFRRRHAAAMPQEIENKRELCGRPGASEQLVEDDR